MEAMVRNSYRLGRRMPRQRSCMGSGFGFTPYARSVKGCHAFCAARSIAPPVARLSPRPSPYPATPAPATSAALVAGARPKADEAEAPMRVLAPMRDAPTPAPTDFALFDRLGNNPAGRGFGVVYGVNPFVFVIGLRQ